MTAGVEAEHDFGTWRVLEADLLRADRYTAIGTQIENGPLAPNIRPAGAARHWTEN